ncbi:MAG TPA: CHASE3 domain-containing protein, partial [Sphingobium sp.]
MPAIRPERSIILLLAALLIVVVAGGGTYWLYVGQQQVNGWVQHTLRVETQLSTLLSRIQAAESSQRGFMLSHSNDFLAPYEDFRARWRGEIDALRDEVRDNAPQLEATNKLERIAEDRLFLLQMGIERRRRGENMAPSDFEAGRVVMNRLRAHIAEMKAREESLLNQRTASANRLHALVSGGMALCAGLITILGLLALRTAYRRVREATESEQALSAANARLIEEAKERKAAEAQVRQMQMMESLGQLTGGIAHDFNNMLAIVIGSLDMARRRLPLDIDSRIRRGIENAAEGAQRAAQLTARLLA